MWWEHVRSTLMICYLREDLKDLIPYICEMNGKSDMQIQFIDDGLSYDRRVEVLCEEVEKENIQECATSASDEQYFVFGKMHGFSIVDGFVEISTCLAEMIKYVANEPSAGLYFIQQHTQNVVPNVIKLKNNVIDKSRETTLHKQDLEDSVEMVRSMKECGFPIAREMIGDITKSLIAMTTKQTKGELLHQSASNFQTKRANTAVYSLEGSEIKDNYFSSVFKFSRPNTNNLKWPQLGSIGSLSSNAEKPLLYRSVSLPDTSANTTSSTQADKQPLSGKVEEESQSEPSDIRDKLLSVSETYDDFKASKQAKLDEWLEGTNNHVENCLPGNEKRL